MNPDLKDIINAVNQVRRATGAVAGRGAFGPIAQVAARPKQTLGNIEQAFTRKPGKYDPGSLYGAISQARQNGNMNEIGLDVALDMTPGVVGATKSARATSDFLQKISRLSQEDRNIMGAFVEAVEKGGRKNMESMGDNAQRIAEAFGIPPASGNKHIANRFNEIIKMADERGVKPIVEGMRQISPAKPAPRHIQDELGRFRGSTSQGGLYDIKKPVKVTAYHGSGDDFTAIDLTKATGKSSGGRTGGAGMWFSSDKKVAKEFADWSGIGDKKPVVKEATIEFKNPKVYEPKDGWDAYQLFRKDLDEFRTKLQFPGRMEPILSMTEKGDVFGKKMLGSRNIQGVDDVWDFEGFRNMLKSQGYDGVVIKKSLTDAVDGIPHDQYLVIDPKTVKLNTPQQPVKQGGLYDQTFFRGEGGNNKFQGVSSFVGGKNYATDINRAKQFGNVQEFKLNPQAKVKEVDVVGKDLDVLAKELGMSGDDILSPNTVAEKLRQQGYDAIVYKTRIVDEAGKISDKSQIVTDAVALTDKAFKNVAQQPGGLYDANSEALKFMDKAKQQKAYQKFLEEGNEDTFSGFLKQFGESVFNTKTGDVVETGGNVKIAKPLRRNW